MDYINKIFKKIIIEQGLPKGKKTNQLVKAITNRNPITFYYIGPREGKDSVKPGVRLRAEAVAMGLSKGGNVIIRMFIEPPSVSKKGYKETGWRTFRLDRMSNIQVISDEVFNTKRPGYKEGDESTMGPMVKTYVTSDWSEKTPTMTTTKPEIKTPEPKEKIKPTDTTLPQPKVSDKPTPTPQEEPKDHTSDVFKTLQPKEVNGEKIITTQDFNDAVQKIYKSKGSEWSSQQKKLNKNTIPGEGTRKRFQISSQSELINLLNKNGVKVSDVEPIQDPNQDENQLQESIKRIKTLMLY